MGSLIPVMITLPTPNNCKLQVIVYCTLLLSHQEGDVLCKVYVNQRNIQWNCKIPLNVSFATVFIERKRLN